MIVSCPACETRFAVDDSLIGPTGRKVKCARCDHRWRQMPAETGDALPQDAMPAPSTATQMSAIAEAIAERLSVASPIGPAASAVPVEVAEADLPDIPSGIIRPRRAPEPIAVPPRLQATQSVGRSGFRTLVLLVGVIVGLLAAAYLLRDMIARSIPGATELYSLVGIRAGNAVDDLEISNIKIVKRDVNEKPAVEITGDIFNSSTYPVTVPDLRATAKDQDGKAIPPTYDFHLQQQVLQPGETSSFRTVYENLPEGTKGVTVNFAQ
ncbi:MAG: DUF3426 domain-containing protein [Dongiaceae bacterium]